MGTRPEAIKLAPVIRCLQQSTDQFKTVVCTTGQHREMLQQVLDIFGIEPQMSLDVMQRNQSLTHITTAVLSGLDKVMAEVQPDQVLVQGDTTTAFAAALAAFYHRIYVAHVEAGLRTDDKYNPFPEEANRRLVSQLASIHFAPTERARQNLLRDGVLSEQILVTGNTVVDALLFTRSRLLEDDGPAIHPAVEELSKEKRIIVMTAHRRESFGEPLQEICRAIQNLSSRTDVEIVYPVHLNPNVSGPVRSALSETPNVKLLAPLDYASFVALMERSYLLLTDSGGIQEEGPALKKPVLVMRTTSERGEAIEAGVARLVGWTAPEITSAVVRLLDDPDEYHRMSSGRNPFGDGTASEQIVERLSGV